MPRRLLVTAQLVQLALAPWEARSRSTGTSIGRAKAAPAAAQPVIARVYAILSKYAAFGIVGTRPSLFLPWMASAISIFLMRQFFLSLPVAGIQLLAFAVRDFPLLLIAGANVASRSVSGAR